MATPIRLTFAASFALLAGCATSYEPESAWNDGGFSSMRRASGVYQVWFVGNKYTSPDMCEELATLRAAELCLGEHKPYMRASQFQTSNSLDDPNYIYRPHAPLMTRSGLEVLCLAEKTGDAQDAGAVAAAIRLRYEIASPDPDR